MLTGNDQLLNSPLGKTASYLSHYNPDLLYSISRQSKRDEIGISSPLPFKGFDRWHAYEVSWLNQNGKPHVAIVQFDIACETSHIVESKSFKLYLNSFNNTKFNSFEAVKQ